MCRRHHTHIHTHNAAYSLTTHTVHSIGYVYTDANMPHRTRCTHTHVESAELCAEDTVRAVGLWGGVSVMVSCLSCEALDSVPR